jgi:hypothetical protein
VTTSRPDWIRHLVPVSWVLLIGGLLIASRVEPTQANWSGLALAGVGTLEAALLFGTLRPCSYRYHLGRSFLTLLILVFLSTGWAANAPLIASPGYTLHVLWLMGLVVIGCLLLGISLWQRLQARHDH